MDWFQQKKEGNSVFYQLLNLAGSGLLMINSFFYGAYPSSGLNIVWVCIAIFTIMRTRFSWHSPSNS